MCVRIIVIRKIYSGYLVPPRTGCSGSRENSLKPLRPVPLTKLHKRLIVAELNISLAEKPASTAALLEQPARVASPVVPPPAMSLGPEAVTTKVRAAERAEEQARRQAEQADNPPYPKKTPAPKKKKTTPELEERQQRAEARMLELGVPPLEASNDFLLIKTCHLCLMYCLILLSTYENFLFICIF